MKRRTACAAALCMTVLAVGAGRAAEFSAEVLHVDGGKGYKGRLVVKGERMRMLVSTPAGQAVAILDFQGGKGYMLYPEKRAYVELENLKDMAGWLRTDADYERIGAKRELMGTEAVQGYECRKYRITFGGSGKTEMLQWYSEKLGCPVRLVLTGPASRTVQELRDIREGNVADSEFEVPAEYRKAVYQAPAEAKPPAEEKGSNESRKKPEL